MSDNIVADLRKKGKPRRITVSKLDLNRLETIPINEARGALISKGTKAKDGLGGGYESVWFMEITPEIANLMQAIYEGI